MAIGDNLTIADGFGCTRFPVDPDLVGDAVTAANLDSGQDSIIGLLKAAINADLGAAWDRLVSQMPASHPLRNRNGYDLPVMHTTDSEPIPALTTQTLFAWPLLAVWPMGTPEAFELTMSLQALRQDWGVGYIMGPLDAAWQRKIGRGFCRLVYRSIQRAIRCGYHPAYQNGQRQFFGQFSEIKTTGCIGPGVVEILDKEKGIGYYGIQVNLQTVERTVQDDFDETDAPYNYAYVPTGTGATLDDWAQTDTEATTENQTAVTTSFVDLGD